MEENQHWGRAGLAWVGFMTLENFMFLFDILFSKC